MTAESSPADHPADTGPCAIGIDCGGTNVKAALYSREGALIRSASLPAWPDDRSAIPPGIPPWADAVRRLAEDLGRGRDIVATGLAAPGLAARDGRSIAWMPGRMNGLEGWDWTEFLGRRVAVLNDAHAALLGEVWQGAAKGLRDVTMLTLGTGVGGAILAEGRLLQGSFGRAGHLGHVSLDPFGAPGITGTPGSLEDAIGDHTVPARSGGRFRRTQEILDAMRAGDIVACDIWRRSVRALAAAVTSIVNILDSEAVVIGGGIAAAGEDLFGLLAEYLDAMEWRPGGRRAAILPAGLGPLAGTCGAAYHALTTGS